MSALRTLAVPLIISFVMTGLFALHLRKVERAFDGCAQSDCRCCFPYPKYTTLQAQEQFDLNWIGTGLAYILQSRPASLYATSLDRQSSTSDYAVTLSCVAIVWFLGAIWIQRLRRGQRLMETHRVFRFVLMFLALLCCAVSVVWLFRAADTQAGRTPVTVIAVIPALILAIAALAEAGLISTLRHRAVVLSSALLLAGFYGWFENSVRLEKVRYELPDRSPPGSKDSAPSFEWDSGPDADAAESGLALHFPLFVVAGMAELALPALGPSATLAVHIGVGFLYWYVILFKLTRSHVPEPRFRVVSFLLFLVRISFGFLTGLTVLLSILPTPHGGASAPFLTAAIGFYVVYRVSRQEVKKGRGAFFPFTGGIEPRGQDVAAR